MAPTPRGERGSAHRSAREWKGSSRRSNVLEAASMTTRKTTTGTSQGATDRPGLPDAEPAPLEERVVSIADLSFGQSPRIVPEDIDHARMLAEVNQVLPPILVNAETMVVIDGRHRVLAARLRGETSIRASLFHGTDDQAYLLGVRANTTHGKPLSLPERLQAASRILKTTPSTSDRTIARVCGLSPRTVAARRTGDPTRNATSASVPTAGPVH